VIVATGADPPRDRGIFSAPLRSPGAVASAGPRSAPRSGRGRASTRDLRPDERRPGGARPIGRVATRGDGTPRLRDVDPRPSDRSAGHHSNRPRQHAIESTTRRRRSTRSTLIGSDLACHSPSRDAYGQATRTCPLEATICFSRRFSSSSSFRRYVSLTSIPPKFAADCRWSRC
jgi:hypothetical protein